VNSTVETALSDGASISALLGTVTLSADDHTGILADAGGFGIAIATDGSAGAVAASIAINELNSTVRATVQDATVNAAGLAVTATGAPTIDALTVAGEASVSSESSAFGGAGSGSGNTITSTVEALIHDSTVTAGTVMLHALDDAAIDADA